MDLPNQDGIQNGAEPTWTKRKRLHVAKEQQHRRSERDREHGGYDHREVFRVRKRLEVARIFETMTCIRALDLPHSFN